MKEAVREFGRDPLDEKVWKRLAAGMHYVATDFAGDGGEDELVDLLAKLDRERGTAGNRVFYLAVPPERDLDPGREARPPPRRVAAAGRA